MDNNDPNLWRTILTHRPPEVWAAIAGGMLYVFQKSGGATTFARAIEAGTSGLFGYSLGPNAAEWSGTSAEVASFVLTAIGYLLLDGVRSAIADREAVKEWVRSLVLKLLGGGNAK